MNAWLLALLSGGPQLISRSFTGNQAFTTPFGVSNLVTVSGKGQDGTPSIPGRSGWQMTRTTTYHRRDGGADYVDTYLDNPVLDGTPKPANHCDPSMPMPDSFVYSDYVACYAYADYTELPAPAKTGDPITAFGKTFPGGTGGPASTTSFANVAVTENTAYALVIPNGCTLTITYYQ